MTLQIRLNMNYLLQNNQTWSINKICNRGFSRVYLQIKYILINNFQQYQFKMTNSLVQQLFKHITNLQQENQILKQSILKYNSEVQQLCKTTGFQNWNTFCNWTKLYFASNDANSIHTHSRKRSSLQQLADNIYTSGKKSFSDKRQDLPIISEQYSEENSKMSGSKISLIQFQGKMPHDFMDSFKSLKVSHDFGKVSKKHSIIENSDQFSDFQYIVLENYNLRREINIMREQLQTTKSSFLTILSLFKSGEKEQISTQQTSLFDSQSQIFFNKVYEQ